MGEPVPLTFFSQSTLHLLRWELYKEKFIYRFGLKPCQPGNIFCHSNPAKKNYLACSILWELFYSLSLLFYIHSLPSHNLSLSLNFSPFLLLIFISLLLTVLPRLTRYICLTSQCYQAPLPISPNPWYSLYFAASIFTSTVLPLILYLLSFPCLLLNSTIPPLFNNFCFSFHCSSSFTCSTSSFEIILGNLSFYNFHIVNGFIIYFRNRKVFQRYLYENDSIVLLYYSVSTPFLHSIYLSKSLYFPFLSIYEYVKMSTRKHT